MGMGTRHGQEKQEDIWIASGDVARSPGHPFYQRLNELLDEEKFDEFVEGLCRKFYAPRMGRPGLAPGIYWFFSTFGAASNKSFELTYASEQLGCSSGKAERLIA
jgi:hypothetical protein